MDYKVFSNRIFIRADRGEDIMRIILEICRMEDIHSATFHGIGAFGQVRVATYIPEKDDFLDHEKEGMLELLSLDGNITHDEGGQIYEHAHAMFSYLDEHGEICFFGGHLKSAVVSYTAEIVIDPIPDAGIGRMTDPYTGITVWNLH
ncbi:MAG: DNA-binding protein [Oscillospiraceae bacterium]|nr:DNA-binding protein [Oscillospiraceae bacterium]